MLKKFVAGWALAALLLSVAPSVRAEESMMMAPKGAAKSKLPALGKPAAKCSLMPDTCSHCKAPMKAVNGTTMKCTKCGMTAAAMCGKCKAGMKAGKCPKCNMTMAQLKGDAKPAMKCGHCKKDAKGNVIKCADCKKHAAMKCGHCKKDAKGNVIKCAHCAKKASAKCCDDPSKCAKCQAKKAAAAPMCDHCKVKLVGGKCPKCG